MDKVQIQEMKKKLEENLKLIGIIDELEKMFPETVNEIPQEFREDMQRHKKMFSLLHEACSIVDSKKPEPKSFVTDPIKRFNLF